MKKSVSAVVVAVLAAAGAAAAMHTETAGAASAAPAVAPVPSLDPAQFAHPKANPYFPLEPGLVTRLRGSDGGQHFRTRTAVTSSTKVIQGVRTHVIFDVTHRRNGSLSERTWDWYASDNVGNVWYFGEDTATYNRRGHLESREGSWMAGKDGAVAGIIMPANPKPTDAYRQEYQRGVAEDQAWIVNRGERARVPAGTFHQVLRSYEWARLEPGVLSLKLYAPGVGIVKEKDVAGGTEVFRLVSVSR